MKDSVACIQTLQVHRDNLLEYVASVNMWDHKRASHYYATPSHSYFMFMTGIHTSCLTPLHTTCFSLVRQKTPFFFGQDDAVAPVCFRSSLVTTRQRRLIIGHLPSGHRFWATSCKEDRLPVYTSTCMTSEHEWMCDRALVHNVVQYGRRLILTRKEIVCISKVLTKPETDMRLFLLPWPLQDSRLAESWQHRYKYLYFVQLFYLF